MRGKLTGFIFAFSAVAGTSRSGVFFSGNALKRFTRRRFVLGMFAVVRADAGKRIVLMLRQKGRNRQKPALSFVFVTAYESGAGRCAAMVAVARAGDDAMMRLAFLLLGADTVRPMWRQFALAGAVWAGIGVAILADLRNGDLTLAFDAAAALIALNGFVSLAAAPFARSGRQARALRGAALLLAGAVVWAGSAEEDAAAVVFGLAFLADGALRATSAALLRAPGWRAEAEGGAAETAAALAILAGWPLPHREVTSALLGFLFLASGVTVLRLAFALRALPEGVSVLSMPGFEISKRPRAAAPPLLPAPICPPGRGALLVHVWTARGTIGDAARRPIFDRYVVAIDRRGVVSTGHSSIEVAPDLYISHYPADDIDHSAGDLRKLLFAGVANDVAGRFQPSLALESAAWQPPTDVVTLHRFNDENLRRWWATYSTDATYNLTSRNCSTTASAALDAATEGLAATGRPWRDLCRLLADPNFWMLSVVRGRAQEMTWTPGLVLDYARLLVAVLERDGSGWGRRLREALRALRRLVAHNAGERPVGNFRRPAPFPRWRIE